MFKQRTNSIYGVPIYFRTLFDKDIDINVVKKKVEENLYDLSTKFMKLQSIIVLPANQIQGFNALYKDGKIYVSNLQSSVSDLVDDIIHEFSHFIEEQYKEQLYSDHKIIEEFLSKRKLLQDKIRGRFGSDKYDFSKIGYNQEFDSFLYNDVGYSLIDRMLPNEIINPYALTSIREYFSMNFEYFFLGYKDKVKQVSPEVYNKIANLVK